MELMARSYAVLSKLRLIDDSALSPIYEYAGYLEASIIKDLY